MQNHSDVKTMLKAYRKANNITQIRLSEILGTCHTQVSRWENGINVPRKLRIKDIEEKLRVDQKAG